MVCLRVIGELLNVKQAYCEKLPFQRSKCGGEKSSAAYSNTASMTSPFPCY